MSPIYLITGITLIMQACHQGSRMTVSLFAIDLGANPLMVGVLISVYSVFPLFFAVYSGRISDRFGSRYPMLFGSIVAGIGLIVPVLWPKLPMLYVSAMLIGAGFVFFNVAVQNLGGSLGSPEERTRNFSTLALGFASGHLLGPVTGGHAIDFHGFTFAYLIFAAFMLLPIGLFALGKRFEATPQTSTQERKNTRELLRTPALRRAIIVSGLMATGIDLYTFYVPIYGHSIGLSATTIGNLLGMFAAATFVVRVGLPVFTRRFGVERVLAIALFASATMFLPFPLIKFVPALYALSFCIGLAMGCGQPLTVNLAYDRSPPGRSGEVVGLRLMVNNLTHMGVPLAAGALGTLFGVAPVFWINALFLTASGYLAHTDARNAGR